VASRVHLAESTAAAIIVVALNAIATPALVFLLYSCRKLWVMLWAPLAR
jgi:hypothetical protein